MQNRYCCDQGDFGKYGLLQCLCAADAHGEALRLGLLWYLVPDEAGSSDGKHTGYLRDTARNLRDYRECDPELWDKLRQLLNRRNIKAIQEAGIVPPGTVFFEEPLAWPANLRANSDAGRTRRIEHRKAWWQRGFDKTRGCQLINFDPDNGLEVKSVPPHGRKGPKYTFIDEVVPFYERGQSLVVYQHIGRIKGMTAIKQAKSRLKQLRKATGAGSAFAMHYHRGTARAYLVIPTEKHAKMLRRRAMKMCEGPWARHFDLTDLS